MGTVIVIALFIGLPLLGYFLFTGVFDLFFPKDSNDSYSGPSKIIDNSVHHHYHDNRTLYVDGDKILPNSDKSTVDS